MEIRGVLGNFFQKNKNIAFEGKKEKSSDSSSLNHRALDFEKTLNLVSSQALSLSEKISGEISFAHLKGHALDAAGALKVLSGEETGRLDQFRGQVLKETVQKQNQTSVVSAQAVSQLKKFLAG